MNSVIFPVRKRRWGDKEKQRKRGRLGLPGRNCTAKGGDKFIAWILSVKKGHKALKMLWVYYAYSRSQISSKLQLLKCQAHHLQKSQAASEGHCAVHTVIAVSRLSKGARASGKELGILGFKCFSQWLFSCNSRRFRELNQLVLLLQRIFTSRRYFLLHKVYLFRV